jgi:hypothetical protein
MKLKLINIHDGVAHFHLIDEDGTKRGISVPCNEDDDVEKIKLEAIIKSKKHIEEYKEKKKKLDKIQKKLDEVDLLSINLEDVENEHKQKFGGN